MPIYAFECTACGHSFERLQRLADADPTECPACDAAQIRRQLTAPAFRLAGSGWYETDFKRDGEKKRNLAGDSGGEGGAAKADPAGKADGAKPDAGKADATKKESPAVAKPEAKPAASPASTPSAG
ncbi:MAG: FmdB family zinc ribbon protein [Xanthomonadaceae bacterium]|nr:FmdB family zinc ribbon protein [Xanthomonadaceae bacterium]